MRNLNAITSSQKKSTTLIFSRLSFYFSLIFSHFFFYFSNSLTFFPSGPIEILVDRVLSFHPCVLHSKFSSPNDNYCNSFKLIPPTNNSKTLERKKRYRSLGSLIYFHNHMHAALHYKCHQFSKVYWAWCDYNFIHYPRNYLICKVRMYCQISLLESHFC